jgi:ABC-type polysaccharide/polyol phosphate export permease
MGLAADLRRLAAAREVLVALVEREFRLRYRQTLIGVLWALLQPLAMMLLAVLIFGRVARLPAGGLPPALFYYSGVLIWTFFAGSLSFGMTSLVNNSSLVTKIYFPREILPVASVLVTLVDLLVAGALLAVLMPFFGIWPRAQALWVVPVLAAVLAFTAGLTMLFAALTVFFRDFRFAVPLLLWLWFFASPVVYPAEMVPAGWRWLYFANPLAGAIDAFRSALLLGRAPGWGPLLSCGGIGLAVLLLSYVLFKRVEGRFADVI